MVLDATLLRDKSELARIFVHETHHFVWARLGLARRNVYERLLEREIRGRARGEMGWSAQALKERLTAADRLERTRRWRDYACESFCDTAAWMHSRARRHAEWTLAETHRRRRVACLTAICMGELAV